jgi:hypothetical protein
VSGGSLPIHFPFLSPETKWKSSSPPNDRARGVQYVSSARSRSGQEKADNTEHRETNAKERNVYN